MTRRPLGLGSNKALILKPEGKTHIPPGQGSIILEKAGVTTGRHIKEIICAQDQAERPILAMQRKVAGPLVPLRLHEILLQVTGAPAIAACGAIV